jgi:hypothetical protein
MTQKAFAESKRARDLALIAEKNSQIAQNKSKIAEDALVLAKKNADDALFQKNVANTKIEQQIARSNAILAQQEYLNGNYFRGYEIAKNAYKQNKINEGNPFDKDILAALYEGYNFLHQKKFIHKNQINKIQMGSKPDLFAFSSIDDSLSVVNDEKTLKLKVENLKYFSFSGESDLIINQAPNRLYKFNLNEASFNEEVVFSDSILSINKVNYEGSDHFFVINENNIELLDGSLKSKGKWSNSLKTNSLTNYKDRFISISGSEIHIIDLNIQGDVSITQQYDFDDKISSVSSVFESSKIALGFDNGNFCIFELEENKIIILNKTHKTEITGCHVIKAKNKSVVVTTGMDSQIKILTGSGSDWSDKKFSLVDNISNHTSWINDSKLDYNKTKLLTASADGSVRFWPLDPETFLNH